MKELKADNMGMTMKEFVGRKEGLKMREIMKVSEGVSVEEMIAMKNDVSVIEMIAMKNDLTVEEVEKINEVLPVPAIIQTRPEILVEEALALKANMTIEELVAMKNDIAVEDVLELKDELDMNNIMKLQDGITKQEAIEIIDDESTVEEIVEEKQEEIAKLQGIRVESERFPNFAKEGSKDMNVIDVNDGAGVSFTEVHSSQENPSILESVLNNEPQKINKEKRKKLQMKMRPLRVKVRKPVSSSEEDELEQDLDLNLDPMDELFGLKQVVNEDLVLDPTPAVPGRPVLFDPAPKFEFDEFLPSTTSPTVIPIENIKTVDFQKEDVTEETDYSIYDDIGNGESFNTNEDVPSVDSFMPPLDMPDFSDIPFSNFPMMKPHEFINLITEEAESNNEDQKDNFVVFNSPDRPESIPPVDPKTTTTQSTPVQTDIDNDLKTFVDVFGETEDLKEDVRPARRPQSNLNHRYRNPPSNSYPTPFTVKPKSHIVDHSYIRNSYKHQKGGSSYNSDYHSDYYDSADTPLFREIPSSPENRFRRKPYQESRPSKENNIKPFTHFGKIPEETDSEAFDEADKVTGLSFYEQYGQHDDRPLNLHAATTTTRAPKTEPVDEDRKRPGEIRFGGMSFALPPPGSYPDIPKVNADEDEEFDYYSDYGSKTLSDVYPNHPASQIFPNRPVSEVFRDLPDTMNDPKFPQISSLSEEPKGSSFNDFFKKEEEQYVDNPFGKDFIKLEVDPARFGTNKTKPGIHHIPLDIHGFPDVPSFDSEEDDFFNSFNTPRRKRKPLYKPPPVLTKYAPPRSSSKVSQEYRNEKEEGNMGLNFKLESEPLKKLSSLPQLMERLMGKHSQWIKRAWQGRDEAAAAAA